MKKEDFRIVEYMGEFTIQRKYETHIGFFKKTLIVRWKHIDTNGAPYLNSSSFQIPLESFDSLDKARRVALSILKGRVIHDIESHGEDRE